MDQGREIVEIDGRRFAVRRLPWPQGQALEVERAPAAALRLAPWTLGDHLAALDRHTYLEDQVPRLDPEGLAREILTRTSEAPLDDDALAELAPLALWWAGASTPEPDPEDTRFDRRGLLRLSRGEVALRPWTSLERARALDACTDPSTGEVRGGSLLRAMIAACVEADDDPLALSGDDAAVLLDAVTRINNPPEDMSEGPGSIALARATLRLCQALGWTPSQVWSAPAREVDRLLALLDLVDPLAPPAPPAEAPSPPAYAHSRLAAYPDAVIIDLSNG